MTTCALPAPVRHRTMSCFHAPYLAPACLTCRAAARPALRPHPVKRAAVWLFDVISDRFLLTGPKPND